MKTLFVLMTFFALTSTQVLAGPGGGNSGGGGGGSKKFFHRTIISADGRHGSVDASMAMVKDEVYNLDRLDERVGVFVGVGVVVPCEEEQAVWGL